MPICDACWTEFSAQSGPACFRCGDALDAPVPGAAETLCRTCRLSPPPFERAVAYGVYEDRIRDAIHALQYGSLLPAASGLGRMLAQAIAQLAAAAPAEMLVIPIPLHRSKYAGRGFNQARLLAVEALKSLRRTHLCWRLTLAPAVLLRHRVTESPAGLTPRQRRLNVRGAFRVSDATIVTDRDVLVIDDILTTGATARAAAQTLLAAGARSVWVATLARVRRAGFVRPGSPAYFKDEVLIDNLPGKPVFINLQPASMYSKDQPSL